jgi:hypothetical protein
MTLAERVQGLRAQGWTVRQIAFELHVSRSLVKRCLRQQPPHGGPGAEEMVGNSLLGPAVAAESAGSLLAGFCGVEQEQDRQEQ